MIAQPLVLGFYTQVQVLLKLQVHSLQCIAGFSRHFEQPVVNTLVQERVGIAWRYQGQGGADGIAAVPQNFVQLEPRLLVVQYWLCIGFAVQQCCEEVSRPASSWSKVPGLEIGSLEASLEVMVHDTVAGHR